ncbi:MAG: 5'-nucleotidase C-terminal domain-containing protein [Acidobacteria bacterium]|nr:5'-nucleotidase C-terminal domain-containing protein [Acidobacteriota bacterium]
MRYAIKFACLVLLLLSCPVGPASNRALAQQSGAATTRPTATTPGRGANTKPTASATNAQTPSSLDLNVRASENAIDASIPDDPAVEALIAPYSAKVRELNRPIGKLVGGLKKDGMGGGSLGNFVADALRNRAEARLGKPVLLAVLNSSGMRKNQIPEGDISTSDIYELLPFENALVTLDFTGEQLRRFLDVIVERRDAQAGAQLLYRNNKELKKNEIVNVKLRSASGAAMEIDPKATYTIVTIDYLVKRGGDYQILQEAKNVVPLSLTMRDAVLDYVKAETAAGRSVRAMLDGRFRYDRSTTGQEAEGEQP